MSHRTTHPPSARRSLRRTAVVAAAAFGLALAPVAAMACDDTMHKQADRTPVAARSVSAGTLAADAPQGDISGVEHLAQLPELTGATALNFLDYGAKKKVMFATGRFGLKSYDITNPEKPVLLDSIDMPGFWENEDMDVDPSRKLVFLSQDPRAFGQPQDSGESGVYIVSARHPDKLEILSFAEVPAGHTTTCINDCKYLWTGGPMKDKDQPADWEGRPIFVTDIRNAKKPKVYETPVDMNRNDGVTDYVHDVQVDEAGVAWASGRGGMRGYWTKGRHWDPVEKKYRVATASDPVPYAGGKFVQQPDVGFPGGSFAHNSLHPLRAMGDYPAGDLALVTIENFSDSCETDGNLVIVSLGDSYDGQGWRSTPENPYRLDIVGEFTPWGQEGSNPATGCSAHYFEMKGDLVVQSFYGNGTRFIDVSDPTDPTQVGYFRPDGGSSVAPYFVGEDLVYVADGRRGVDILRMDLGN